MQKKISATFECQKMYVSIFFEGVASVGREKNVFVLPVTIVAFLIFSWAPSIQKRFFLAALRR